MMWSANTHSLEYTIWAAVMHVLFSLVLLALPLVVCCRTLTTSFRGSVGHGATTGVFLLSFVASWGLHIFADTYGLGF